MVANIYVQDRVEHKIVVFFFYKLLSRKYLHLWDTLDDLATVYSGYSLVSSKLSTMHGFNAFFTYPFPLALPLDQNENWDSPYSHQQS